MELVLMFKAKKIPALVPPDGTVTDLQCMVEKLLSVEQHKQKLIHKGTTVSNTPDRTLASFGIKQGSRIMVIGKSFSHEEEEVLKVLQAIESDFKKYNVTVDELSKQLDDHLKGFNENYSDDISKHVRKGVLTASENLMRLLEKIDQMILKDEFTDAKIKRKTLVKNIQIKMDKCESCLEKLADQP